MSEEKITTQPPKEGYKINDLESNMSPAPISESDAYKPAGKMIGLNTLITGADSGIGKAVAIAFAKEGANVCLVDLEETEDLEKTKNRIKEIGTDAMTFAGDVGEESFAQKVIQKTIEKWGSLHTFVSNAGEQHPQKKIGDISAAQLDRTFRTNVFGMFYFVKAIFPHLEENGTIITTSSITAYKGSPGLMDYAATKGAIVSFTRSFAQNEEVLSKKIRVNSVAPGPIWTPLIPATLGSPHDTFGDDVPMKKPGEAYELAPAYVYLATSDSSYVTGQTIHVNGGTVING